MNPTIPVMMMVWKELRQILGSLLTLLFVTISIQAACFAFCEDRYDSARNEKLYLIAVIGGVVMAMTAAISSVASERHSGTWGWCSKLPISSWVVFAIKNLVGLIALAAFLGAVSLVAQWLPLISSNRLDALNEVQSRHVMFNLAMIPMVFTASFFFSLWAGNPLKAIAWTGLVVFLALTGLASTEFVGLGMEKMHAVALPAILLVIAGVFFSASLFSFGTIWNSWNWSFWHSLPSTAKSEPILTRWERFAQPKPSFALLWGATNSLGITQYLAAGCTILSLATSPMRELTSTEVWFVAVLWGFLSLAGEIPSRRIRFLSDRGISFWQVWWTHSVVGLGFIAAYTLALLVFGVGIEDKVFIPLVAVLVFLLAQLGTLAWPSVITGAVASFYIPAMLVSLAYMLVMFTGIPGAVICLLLALYWIVMPFRALARWMKLADPSGFRMITVPFLVSIIVLYGSWLPLRSLSIPSVSPSVFGTPNSLSSGLPHFSLLGEYPYFDPEVNPMGHEEQEEHLLLLEEFLQVSPNRDAIHVSSWESRLWDGWLRFVMQVLTESIQKKDATRCKLAVKVLGEMLRSEEPLDVVFTTEERLGLANLLMAIPQEDWGLLGGKEYVRKELLPRELDLQKWRDLISAYRVVARKRLRTSFRIRDFSPYEEEQFHFPSKWENDLDSDVFFDPWHWREDRILDLECAAILEILSTPKETTYWNRRQLVRDGWLGNGGRVGTDRVMHEFAMYMKYRELMQKALSDSATP